MGEAPRSFEIEDSNMSSEEEVSDEASALDEEGLSSSGDEESNIHSDFADNGEVSKFEDQSSSDDDLVGTLNQLYGWTKK